MNLQNTLPMKSINDDPILRIPKFVWLASFPKSGNTWFRSFLSALMYGKVDINQLRSDGHFSSIITYSNLHDIDCRMMSSDEMFLHIPNSLRAFCKKISTLQFFKVHDAYRCNVEEIPIFPKDITYKVFYLVRNPLDVVASYANHLDTTIENAIKMMNNPKGSLVPIANAGHHHTTQLYQLMYDWSGHVKSWLDQKELDVHVIRYEDMKKQPFETFSKAMASLGCSFSDEQIQVAIDLTTFEKLKQQEEEKGFRERANVDGIFFRKGKVDGWKEELTTEQVQIIKNTHGEVMNRLGYDL